MTNFPVSPRLPDDVLRRQSQLPLKPAPVTLIGGYVRLEPLDLERDVEALYVVSNGQPARLGDRTVGAYDADQIIWRYMPGGPFVSVLEFGAWLRSQVMADNGLCLCVIDVPSGRPVGVVNYMNNLPSHL